MSTSDLGQSRGIGLLHTDAWAAISGSLQRLLSQLQSSATKAEQKAQKQLFVRQLIEQVRELRWTRDSPTAGSAPKGSPTSSSAHAQLNSLAYLAVATFYDKYLVSQDERHEDTPHGVTGGVYQQVRARSSDLCDRPTPTSSSQPLRRCRSLAHAVRLSASRFAHS